VSASLECRALAGSGDTPAGVLWDLLGDGNRRFPLKREGIKLIAVCAVPLNGVRREKSIEFHEQTRKWTTGNLGDGIFKCSCLTWI